MNNNKYNCKVVPVRVQSTVTAEAPVTDTEVMEQDPPIDPSVESAPRREPALPVSTMTGQVTSTPQLGPAKPGVTQEITPVSFPILGLSPRMYSRDYSHLLCIKPLLHLSMAVLFILVFAACQDVVHLQWHTRSLYCC